MFFNELDLLEIRLNILDRYVDYFVIGESKQTFSGKEKPLIYPGNGERFGKWRKKVIYVEIPDGDFANAFERAAYQKDFLRSRLLFAETGMSWKLPNIKDDDIVYFGDLDEIWKPKEIADDKVYNLHQLNYSYFLNNRSSEEWVGTVVGKWGTIKQNTFNYWRAHHENVLSDGGWHFTNMGGPDQIRLKLESYDHQEFNTDQVKDNILARMAFGEDYVGRKVDWLGNPFSFSLDESELPTYILDNREKYASYFK